MLALSRPDSAIRCVFLRITVVDLVDLVLRIYLFALLLYWIDELRVARRLRAGRPVALAAVRTDLEAGAPDHPADRSDRFLVPLGVDRDRRAVVLLR